MDKVGIITIIDYNNYGNRLQNYAVQEIIKSLEFDPITIINEPISSNRNLKERLKDKPLKDVFKYGFNKTKKIITPKNTHIFILLE